MFKLLFNLSESRISVNSCWVEVSKNDDMMIDEHLAPRESGVIKEAPLTYT